MAFIKINKNSPSSSTVVSTVDIKEEGNYWIGELPKPEGLKAVSSITFKGTWVEYNTYSPNPQTKYGVMASLHTCPVPYGLKITYADISSAGGFKDSFATFHIGTTEPKLPYDSTVVVDTQENPSLPSTVFEVTSEKIMREFFKTKSFAVSGGSSYPCSGKINPIYIYYTYTDAVPFPTSMSPSVGVIDEKIENTFSWDIGFNGFVGESIAQAKAKFEWKLKGEADEKIRVVDIDGDVKHYTLPANTLQDGDIILWRVTLTTNAGITGSPSAWIEIGTHESEPPKCKTITPNGIYVDGKSDVTFRWEHISPIGSKPTGYDIQIKKENQWTTIKTEMKTDKTTCGIPGTEFKAGTNYWRARTYNSDEVVGYWSEATAFYVVAKPDTPVLYPVESAKPRPLVRWASEGQTGYQVQVLRNGVVVYDSGMTAGTDTSYKITEYLDDGTYLFRVRIQNMFNKLSEWGEYNHTISTQKPEKPTFLAVSIPDMGIKLTLTYQLKKGETAKIKRDGKIIADIKNDFWDYSALGEVTYSIIVIDRNDCFNESEKQTLSYYIRNVQLSLASDLKQTVHLKLHTEPNAPIRETYGSIGYTESTFAGRDLPCIDFSEHSSERVTLNFACKTPAEFEKLKSLCKLRQPFLYRDHMGEQFYCIIPEFTDTKLKVYTTFQLTLIKIDYRGDAR